MPMVHLKTGFQPLICQALSEHQRGKSDFGYLAWFS